MRPSLLEERDWLGQALKGEGGGGGAPAPWPIDDLLQVPGGWLASRVGGARVYGVGLAATALLTIVTPPLAKAGMGWLIAVRVIEGLFEVKEIAKRDAAILRAIA